MKIFRNWVFKWWEVGLLKLCLISLGIILGLYFYKYLVNLMPLWWAIFIIIWIYFIFYMFAKNKSFKESKEEIIE